MILPVQREGGVANTLIYKKQTWLQSLWIDWHTIIPDTCLNMLPENIELSQTNGPTSTTI
jgi:hypothetical protein